MILYTFESIYGRTLYEHVDDNSNVDEDSDAQNEAGIYKVTAMLSE